MINGYVYDLEGSYEVVGVYPPKGSTEKSTDEENYNTHVGGSNNGYQHEVPQEWKNRAYKARTVQRAKTAIRRAVSKSKMSYMWTFTIATDEVVTMDAKGQTKNHDTTTLEGAWSLWKIFLQRCRKDGFNFDYLVVPEFTEKGRVHFHVATNQRIPQTKLLASKSGKKHWMNKYWTFGFTKATKPKKLAFYLTKYLTKTFDDFEKGARRYRMTNGLKVQPVKHTFENELQVEQFINRQGGKIDFFTWFTTGMNDSIEIIYYRIIESNSLV